MFTKRNKKNGIEVQLKINVAQYVHIQSDMFIFRVILSIFLKLKKDNFYYEKITANGFFTPRDAI